MAYGQSSVMSRPFNPLNIPNLVAWFDASDSTTITASSGAVSQWSDKSGNGYPITQSTAAAQPTTGSTTLNGLNVITFDGGDELNSAYSYGQFRSAQKTTVIAVVKSDRISAASEGLVGAERSSSYDFTSGWLLERRTSYLAWTVGYGGASASSIYYNLRRFSNSSTSWMIYSADVSAASATVNGYVNGSAQTYTTFDGSMATSSYLSSATSDHRLNVGGRGFLTGYRFKGAVAEILVFSRQLAATEYTALNTYINAKWAVY